jgi:hypothetical protein
MQGVPFWQVRLMEDIRDQIINFCNIQLQIMDDKENRLRREILDCKIQREFLSSVLTDLYDKTSTVYNKPKTSK